MNEMKANKYYFKSHIYEPTSGRTNTTLSHTFMNEMKANKYYFKSHIYEPHQGEQTLL